MFMPPLYAGIAQLVERNLAKVEVAGSIPARASNIPPRRYCPGSKNALKPCNNAALSPI